MVGFNRRFAPHTIKMKGLLDALKEPKCLLVTVNAGALPAGHWAQDPQVGGGRIIGEACHFIDLMNFLVGRPVTRIQAIMAGKSSEGSVREDRATLTLGFADGSTGTVHYLANGHKSFPKECIEV